MSTIYHLYGSSIEELERELHDRYVGAMVDMAKAAHFSAVDVTKLMSDVSIKLAEDLNHVQA